MVGPAATSDPELVVEPRSVFSSRPDLPAGLSLERLLELAPLTPEQGAMVGAAILNQLAVAGAGAFAPADLEPRRIRVFPDGAIAIVRAGGAPTDGEGEPRAVLRAAGGSICAALGVSPDGAGEGGFTAAEAVALPLVVHARALAVGAAGGDAAEAAHVYLDRAGRLGAAERLECSREELAALVSRLLQSATPSPAPSPRIAASVGRRVATAPGVAWRVPVVAALALAALSGAALYVATAARPQPTTAAKAPAVESPVPSIAEQAVPEPPPVSTPLRLPTFAPASTPPIRSVAASFVGTCRAGSRCSVDVAIAFQPSHANLKLAWKFELVDTCTGAVVEEPGGGFSAQAGWSRIESVNRVQVPAARAPVLVVVTTAPAAAQSAPLALQPAGGC